MNLKEEIIRNLIKDKNFADELCNFPVRDEDMMQLVCHAPISLFEKQSFYRILLGKKNCGNVNSESGNVGDSFLLKIICG